MIEGIRLIEIKAGPRLDRALADAAPDLSRSRIQALLAEGAITRGGVVVDGASSKASAGIYELLLPPVTAAEPLGQDMGLVVLFEDADLIVIDKPAGMSAHPAPGSAGRYPSQRA